VTRATAGVGAICCLGGAVVLHAAQERWSPPPADRPELLYVRSPAVAKRAALSYQGIAADLYWIRALQHFGNERLKPPGHARNYSLLYPLLDLTTTLDPYFSIAYRFGAIFLGEAYPGGPGRPDLAIALLEKGIAAQPEKWQYVQDLGFVYYWHLRDFKAAAATFQRAADMPGAPSWLRPLAAVTLAEGGQRSASRALWQQLAQSDEEWLRTSAALRLAQLDAMDIMEAWRRYRRDRGVTPPLPNDPSGTPFVIDPATSDIAVSRESKLFPLPGQIQSPR
jgi:tetratricopeptide (TPR) repeat protein